MDGSGAWTGGRVTDKRSGGGAWLAGIEEEGRLR